MTKSIYDQLNASGTIAKQRVVETFSGDALDTDRWTDSGTGIMADEVDGGFNMPTGTSSGNNITVSFNDVSKPFNNQGAVFISVSKFDSLASVKYNLGFIETINQNNSFSYTLVDSDNGNTNLNLMTDDGTTSSFCSGTSTGCTGSTTASTTNWFVNKIELTPSNNTLSIDGSLIVTKTTNLPDAGQQPWFHTYTRTTSAKTQSVRYLEAYNT